MITLVIALIFACNTLIGHLGASNDIQESKDRGVFIQEYAALENNFIKINDSLSIEIKEAWIECKWSYGNPIAETKILNGYQLCINTNEKDIENVDFDWTIGLNGDHYLHLSNNSSLIGDFDRLPDNDTILYEVQKGANLSSDGEKKIIGNFILIKAP